MPGENVYDWSVTAGDNGSADTLINFLEGQSRASVNNSARSMMAALAKQRNLQNGSITVAGTANALTFTSGVGYTTVPANMRVLLKLAATNTASATLNMDGLGAVTIKNPIGADLAAADLKAGFFAELIYNGTNWILLSVFLPPVVFSNGTIPTVPVGGDPNTVTVTTGTNLTALYNGLRLTLRIGATNTGPVTMNVDGLGAKDVVDQLGNPLIGGEMVAGTYADFVYDGTDWVLLAATLNPAFYLKRTALQYLPVNLFAKIQLDVKEFDIGNYFNTTTFRYTPLVAGRYLFIGYAVIGGLTLLSSAAGIGIFKNGVQTNVSLAGVITGGGYFTVDVVLDMNGTTDYVELWGFGWENVPVVTVANMQGIRLS